MIVVNYFLLIRRYLVYNIVLDGRLLGCFFRCFAPQKNTPKARRQFCYVKMNNLLPLLVAVFLFSAMQISAQDLPDNFSSDNKIYNESIKTVILSRRGANLTEPIVALNSADKLELSFDEISDNSKEYYFSIVHCTANWEISDLLFNEYAEGYESVDIENFNFSFNTTVTYCNYYLELPCEDLKFTISGNYILYVFEDNDTEKIVLTKRFRVVEDIVGINCNVKRATLPLYKETKQEVDVSLTTQGLGIIDPYSEISLFVSQNNCPHNTINLQPKYVNGSTIDYNYEEENLFDGINEFRHFDVSNIKFAELETANIFYDTPFYHFVLRADEVAGHSYSYERDINGRFKIHQEDSRESHIDADYVVVHFILPFDAPLIGKIYVTGGFTDWQLTPDYEMKYDLEKKTYLAHILVKQGYYDYRYVFIPLGKDKPENDYIERNFSDTENDYTLYVYYRSMSGQYDRLVGIRTFSSIKKY